MPTNNFPFTFTVLRSSHREPLVRVTFPLRMGNTVCTKRDLEDLIEKAQYALRMMEP